VAIFRLTLIKTWPSVEMQERCTCLGSLGDATFNRIIDNLQLTGHNLGLVFNSMLGRACICSVIAFITKQPSFKLKPWPKQLLGSRPLDFMLSAWINSAQGAKVSKALPTGTDILASAIDSKFANA
jgi:hypothetical protein